jgi:tetratricopeptide (TPR) repeat protein
MSFFRWKRRSPETSADSAVSPLYPLLYEAQVQLQLEQYDNARPFLLQALEYRDEIEDTATTDYLLNSLGASWIFTEKYDEGITALSEYINRYSRDPVAHRERGALRWYSGQLEAAIRDYSESLALRPNDILSLSGRGQLLAETGQIQNALDDLNLALGELKILLPGLDPAMRMWHQHVEAFVHNGRAVAFSKLGESASAMKEFDLSIILCAENAWVYFNRARVFDSTQESANACSDFQIALAKSRPPLNPIQKAYAEKRLRELKDRDVSLS